MKDNRNVFKILTRKHKVKCSRRGPWDRRGDNINTNLKEIGIN